jgi:opacity protein-like surface antigen
MTRVRVALAFVLTATLATAAAAQGTARPAPVVEGAAGWAGFLDEEVVRHGLVATAARVYVSRRVSLGPEVQYFVGPNSDRDLIVTGNLMVDLLAPTADRPKRTTPFVVVGGGLFRHSDRFNGRSFSSTEGAYTAGVGVRTWATDRLFVAGDARLGWEAHLRLAVTVGLALR